MRPNDPVLAIDALLPQTQCTRCGYPACLPYAQALVEGRAELNLCEPGGASLIPLLAHVLQRPRLPPVHAEPFERLAWIREEDCIGCARCLPACPVDAILGARRLSHTVITADCTACELCVPACPVDCIELRPAPSHWEAPAAALNRARYAAHQARVAKRAERGRAAPGKGAIDAASAAAPAAADQVQDDVGGKREDPAKDRAERRAAMIAAARAAAAARRQAP